LLPASKHVILGAVQQSHSICICVDTRTTIKFFSWTMSPFKTDNIGDHRCRVDCWQHSAIRLNATNPSLESISKGRKEIRD
jgi:hypothetical protein